LVNTTCE